MLTRWIKKARHHTLPEWAVACVLAVLAVCLPFAAYGQAAARAGTPGEAPPLQEQCIALPAQQWVADSQKARPPTRIESKTSVLPGGRTIKLQLFAAPVPKDFFYCARFVRDGLTARVMDYKVSQDDPNKTELTVVLPEIGFGWQRTLELTVMSLPIGSDGMLNAASPGTYAVGQFPVSNGPFSLLVSVLVVVLAYVAAVLALGRVGTSYSWNPVYLTSDSSDKASLSQFQIFAFTLIVLWLLTYIVLRTGLLSDISQDVLLLLGISAAGAAGSKVANHMKKRLSYENWAWLRNHQWLTAYEAGTGQASDPRRARWGDLLKTDGDFDIYSFQLAVFSIVVAYSLLDGADKLATFTIPENLKALLGLSNVVYIGGKAISPDSVGELDKKVSDLRVAELAWLGLVINAVTSQPDQHAKREAAIAAAPKEYQAYMGIAREAARMLRSLYGAEGTRFKLETIDDGDLVPEFP